MEIRIAVADPAAVHGLMRRFVDVFGRAAVSYNGTHNEVHVRSEWGSRAVDQVIDAVRAWLSEDGVPSARLAIGDADYTVIAQ